MSKKDLVQELREAVEGETSVATIDTLEKILGVRWDGKAAVINALADRIKAEYEPKPEPDTVEKVARDMYATFHEMAYIVSKFKGKNFTAIAEGYRKRLEALGVTFDD